MFKLFKYEMVGRVRLMAAVIIGIFLFNTLIAYKLGGTGITRERSDIALGLTFLVGFTAGVIAFFNAILLFKRDLYSETGYLIYTIPKKAYYIIHTKLLAAMIEIGVYGIIGGAFFIIRFYKYENVNLNQVIHEIMMNKVESFELLLLMVLSIAFTYLLAYFSMALSRATFGNRRYGEFLAIIIFFVISFIIGRVSVGIGNTFDFSQIRRNWGEQMMVMLILASQLALCIAFAAGTHFVIEKKVDL